MTKNNDNRMGWIRNLEALDSGREQYSAEYELGSECHIPGLLDYGDGKIICAAMSIDPSRDGFRLYNLVLRFPVGPGDFNRQADNEGYYLKGGVLGELLALMSVFFRCRFYLLSSRLPPANPRLGMTLKTEYPLVRIRCDPGIHPPLFEGSNKNLATGFREFLDALKGLDQKLHQKFILACHHYARAVKEVGVDTEMVFIRLVSAIEALAADLPLDGKDDNLENRSVTQLIEQSGLPKELKSELKTVFDVRKSRKRFIRLVEKHSRGFFRGGNFKARPLKIKRADLGKILNTIYTARSKYLHAGEPMYLSQPSRGGEKWDVDPTLGMIADNRSFTASQKLPYTHFFEGLVRQCLLNYMRENLLSRDDSVGEYVFAYGSNMCSGRFRDYEVSTEGAARAAVLRDHKLLFNKRSTKDKSGKANVVAQAGSDVWGVLYTIPHTDLQKLDKGEGGYRRVQLPVHLTDNTNITAWVYVAKRSVDDPALRPYTWYKRFLVEGAREHSLPADYIVSLDMITAVEDTDAERDREKRTLNCP